MKALSLLLVMLTAPGASPRDEPDGGGRGLLTLIADLVLGEESSPWAKPVREADMGLIGDLLDRDVLTEHPAEWWVVPVVETGDV
jgi:hypothetical protein